MLWELYLEYINSHNESGFKCYSTKKTSLDDNNIDTISAENSDTDTIPIDTKGKFAEDDGRLINTVKINHIFKGKKYSSLADVIFVVK